jgi:hypothetical protein
MIRMIIVNSTALSVLLIETVIGLSLTRTMPLNVMLVFTTCASLLAMSFAQINIFDTPNEELTQQLKAVIDIPSSDSVLPDNGSSVAKYMRTGTGSAV